jgi:hypothetical protein
MAGTKTIQLPDDPQAARQQLATMLVDPAPFIFLFLFGDDAQTRILLDKADLYAGGDQFDTHRRVVYARTFAPIAGCFLPLKRAAGVDPVDTPGTAGFATSGAAIVARLLSKTANDADIVMAYIAAEGLTS